MVDGLVNFNNWNYVWQGLPDNKGSRIMIITRLEDKEAAYVDTKVSPLHVGYLSEDDTKELFNRKVFGSKNQFYNKVFGSNADMSTDGKDCLKKINYKDIFDITQGLPLAIVLLAGFLRTKNFAEWEKVLSQLRSDNKAKQMKRILALCFEDLPSRLKSCFLYFAGMPENLVFSAWHIVRLWAAEGFLKPKKGKTMEDIGQSYLKELISRGMINLVRKDQSGGVWLVSIHDRVHAFAQSESHEESFLEVHDNSDLLMPNSVRRLCLLNYMQSYVTMDTSFPKLRSLLCDFAEDRTADNSVQSQSQSQDDLIERTAGNSVQNQQSQDDLSERTADNSVQNQSQDDLRYHGLQFLPRCKFLHVFERMVSNLVQNQSQDGLRYHRLQFLPRCQFLRVIDLRGMRIKKLPNAIGDMVHLRYLGIRSRSLVELPSTIRRLINLQTLDIKRSQVQNVTPAFWKIATLRHVMANRLKFPMSVGALSHMQTLTGLVCSDSWNKITCPLEHMVYLRRLQITGLTSEHWKSLADAFKKLESLVYLQLAVKLEVLDKDKIPFDQLTKFTLQRLQILELHGRIQMPEGAIKERYTLPNLNRLVLKDSMVNQEFMNRIGELPSLRELVLSNKSYSGIELIFSDSGFNSVTNLVMSGLENLVEWTIRPKSIPSIQRIALAGFSQLKINLKGIEIQGSLKGLMNDLEEVVVFKKDNDKKIVVEPVNEEFSKRINHVPIETNSEDIIDATLTAGRWRERMVAGSMYHQVQH